LGLLLLAGRAVAELLSGQTGEIEASAATLN